MVFEKLLKDCSLPSLVAFIKKPVVMLSDPKPKPWNAIPVFGADDLRKRTWVNCTDNHVAAKNIGFGMSLGCSPSPATLLLGDHEQVSWSCRPQRPPLDLGVKGAGQSAHLTGLVPASWETTLVQRSAWQKQWKKVAAALPLVCTILTPGHHPFESSVP